MSFFPSCYEVLFLPSRLFPPSLAQFHGSRNINSGKFFTTHDCVCSRFLGAGKETPQLKKYTGKQSEWVLTYDCYERRREAG